MYSLYIWYIRKIWTILLCSIISLIYCSYFIIPSMTWNNGVDNAMLLRISQECKILLILFCEHLKILKYCACLGNYAKYFFRDIYINHNKSVLYLGRNLALPNDLSSNASWYIGIWILQSDFYRHWNWIRTPFGNFVTSNLERLVFSWL